MDNNPEGGFGPLFYIALFIGIIGMLGIILTLGPGG